MGLLDGRTAMVTGAASGIGRAIALAFARKGAALILTDITSEPKEGGAPTLDLIEAQGGRAMFITADVAQWDDINAAVNAGVEAYGRLDIMVNNAATYASKPLHETTHEEWETVVAVNLTGMFHGCKRAVQQMLTQEPINDVRGRIVNITSQHGMVAAPQDFAYGVTKAGGVYMTRQIAADYAKSLIICNAVAPGKIITGKPGVANDPAALDYSRARTPMPRLGEPRDVANAAVFLASDMATYITGVNLMVDGGWMAA